MSSLGKLLIDDNELENLKKVCNEIFGSHNFVGQWNWYKSATPPNLSKKIKKNIEYILCYEKKKNTVKYRGIQKTSPSSNGLLNQTNRFSALKFPANVVETGLKDGVYKAGKYGTSNYEINLLNDVEVKNGLFISDFTLEGKFKWGQSNLLEEIKKGTKIAIRTNTFSPSYEKAEYDPEVPPNFIDKSVGVDTTEQAGKKVAELFDGMKVFDYPKPIDLIMYLSNFICNKNDLIMDFFSGSATTAHAVMQQNENDGGRRSFILVQMPEVTSEVSDAFKGGYSNICEIGKERIRRAGIEIKRKNPSSSIDIGFRVFKCDSSNMRDVFYAPDGIVRNSLEDYVEVIKSDRGPEDLIIQVMLELGIELSSKIECKRMGDNTVFSIDDGFLVACFDDSIDDSTVIEISKEMSGCMYAVFRSGSSMSDEMLSNIEQIFKTYSPQTKIRIL